MSMAVVFLANRTLAISCSQAEKHAVSSHTEGTQFLQPLHTLENSSKTMAPSSKSLCGMLNQDNKLLIKIRCNSLRSVVYLRRSEVAIPVSLLRASTMFTSSPGLRSA